MKTEYVANETEIVQYLATALINAGKLPDCAYYGQIRHTTHGYECRFILAKDHDGK